jgi:hypothetical protein
MDYLTYMRKSILAIIAIVYLTVSARTISNDHYCMGKLVSSYLTTKETGNCDGCGMKDGEQNGCCRNEQRLLKLYKDQRIPLSIYKLNKICQTAFSFNYTSLHGTYDFFDDGQNPPRYESTPENKVHLFTRNRVFRI